MLAAHPWRVFCTEHPLQLHLSHLRSCVQGETIPRDWVVLCITCIFPFFFFSQKFMNLVSPDPFNLFGGVVFPYSLPSKASQNNYKRHDSKCIIKKHPILPRLSAFYNNLLQNSPNSCNLVSFISVANPSIAILNFSKNTPKGRHIYVYMSMWELPDLHVISKKW